MSIVKRFSLFTMILFTVAACAGKPQPANVENICSIFKQYPKWYWATQDVQKRWGVPINVQMAIIYQESRFSAKAKPPRGKLLGIIPWKRPSSAKGYSQALKGTWDEYQESAGKNRATRSAFADAADFVGWYGYQANQRAGISRSDAYPLYLAYHEGIGGYQRRSYANKTWLINIAQKVQSRAATYQRQLQGCQAKLKKKPWYRFW
ncbi:MAG: hypothetical protein V3V61_07600 [Gammaproteobacteria bacterium]